MKILAVEDDKIIADILKSGLTSESHTVEIAEDGHIGSFLSRSYDYDAIILDHTLPKKSGLDLCKEIRASGKTVPIIFLSVTSDADTKVSALESGADDYMTKPFSLVELNARLRALARRPHEIKKQNILTLGDIVLDKDKQTVFRGKTNIKLTRKEFGVLEYMLRHVDILLSRTSIMEHVWTADSDPFSNTVEAHIRNLRRKLNAGKKPNMITNLQGRGYTLSLPSKERTR